jgi:hypothetical protein
MGKDTTVNLCTTLFDRKYKILLYVDSLGCTNCKLHLLDWKRLIAEADSLYPEKLSFLFYFHPKDKKELFFLFKRDKLDYPVFIDNDNALEQLNHFPNPMQYQCFLLDESNKVLMIGNPTLNPKVWELYKTQVFGEKEKPEVPITTIEMDKRSFDFGDIRINTTNEAVFAVKNTGNAPLFIRQVSASCGCTAVEWDKQPVEPGQTAKVKVEMTPEETGHFNKTIEVFCNAKESPVKLAISGTATK